MNIQRNAMKRSFILLLITYNVLCSNFTELFHAGSKAFDKKKYSLSASYFEQALVLQPQQPALLYNLSICYLKLSQEERAIKLLHRLITLHPTYTKAYHQLIHLYKNKNDTEQVAKTRELLLAHEPKNIQVHLDLAREYKQREQFENAIKHFRHILDIEPNNSSAQFELALTYILIGETQQAINLYDRMLKIHPNNVTMMYNKGYAYKMSGNADMAIKLYQETLTLDPQYDSAHFALGMAYLIKGDYERGWQKHTRYLKQVGRNGDALRQFLARGITKGKRILLRPEGGLGDSINFVRYARELKRYGIYVIVAVTKPLYRLFSNCDYIDELIEIGSAMPPFHDHTTLMSIPAILYSHEHRLPDFEPYIYPVQERVDYWQNYLKEDTHFKIGICWEASVYNDSSRPPVARRGIPLELMYILSELDNVSIYSLQQHDGVEQLQSIPPYFKIHVFDETFDRTHGSFVDTAAVMQHMDLILSVDTATAHLAGAMGRPVWLLLPWATDWRWLEHRTTSPWYPTMRIFKQPKPFDWQSVMQEVYWQLMQTVGK